MRNPRIDVRTMTWKKSSYSNADGGCCVEIADAIPAATIWRKSSHSNGDGGECLEVTDVVNACPTWHKSSHSNADGGECVEVAAGLPALVPVRDSKVPDGPILGIPTTAWTSFVDALRRDAL